MSTFSSPAKPHPPRSSGSSMSRSMIVSIRDKVAEAARRRELMELQRKEELEARRREHEERLQRVADQKQSELEKRKRDRIQRELQHSKAVNDRRFAQLEQIEVRKKEILERAHALASRTAQGSKKKVFAFGSSTPRELSYLEKLNKDQKQYDKQLVVPPVPGAPGRTPPRQAGSVASSTGAPSKSSMTTSMYVPRSTPPVKPAQKFPLRKGPAPKKEQAKEATPPKPTPVLVPVSRMTQSMYDNRRSAPVQAKRTTPPAPKRPSTAAHEAAKPTAATRSSLGRHQQQPPRNARTSAASAATKPAIPKRSAESNAAPAAAPPVIRPPRTATRTSVPPAEVVAVEPVPEVPHEGSAEAESPAVLVPEVALVEAEPQITDIPSEPTPSPRADVLEPNTPHTTPNNEQEQLQQPEAPAEEPEAPVVHFDPAPAQETVQPPEAVQEQVLVLTESQPSEPDHSEPEPGLPEPQPAAEVHEEILINLETPREPESVNQVVEQPQQFLVDLSAVPVVDLAVSPSPIVEFTLNSGSPAPQGTDRELSLALSVTEDTTPQHDRAEGGSQVDEGLGHEEEEDTDDDAGQKDSHTDRVTLTSGEDENHSSSSVPNSPVPSSASEATLRTPTAYQNGTESHFSKSQTEPILHSEDDEPSKKSPVPPSEPEQRSSAYSSAASSAKSSDNENSELAQIRSALNSRHDKADERRMKMKALLAQVRQGMSTSPPHGGSTQSLNNNGNENSNNSGMTESLHESVSPKLLALKVLEERRQRTSGSDLDFVEARDQDHVDESIDEQGDQLPALAAAKAATVAATKPAGSMSLADEFAAVDDVLPGQPIYESDFAARFSRSQYSNGISNAPQDP